MMLLKSIELQGYKTFAGRTTFEFAGSITCIVGPNGSGKSNIADAIRWVLGEQSYRLLRGKKTEDMIFSGSESRSRAGMASVNIIFDNTTGWLPVDFSEVSIVRRAYRDGTNEYLLNGQRVRLRDITELLGRSGLSERTYTVIGQGLVDAALALRAEERRSLFEEAAGTGIYRTRREEAQRRLETTQRNLERVEDILSELKPRLRSLERQTRRVERYEQVEKDLKALLKEYYGYHWYRAQRDLNQARETARVQESIYETVRQEQDGLDQKLTAWRAKIQGLRARLGSWHRESSQLHNQRETITRDLAVADERLRSLDVQKQTALSELARMEGQINLYQERLSTAEVDATRLSEELAEARSQLASATETLQTLQSEREQAAKSLNEIRAKIAEITNNQNRTQARLVERQSNLERQYASLDKVLQTLSQFDCERKEIQTRLKAAENTYQQISAIRQLAEKTLGIHRQKLEKTNQTREDTARAISECTTSLARMNTQLGVLEQAERALTGYADGTRLLLKSIQDGQLNGARGALSSQLDVPVDLEVAIVSALGEFLDAVILEDTATTENGLDLLLANASPGAMLVIDGLTPPPPLASSHLEGVIGVASTLVKAPPELRPAVDLLLGQTLVVSDRRTARLALRDQPLTTRAVTLQGEVFYATGPVSIGHQGHSSTISRPRQRRELQEQVSTLEDQISLLQAEIKGIDQTLSLLRSEENDLSQDLEDTLRQESVAAETCSQLSLELERVNRNAKWQRDQHDELQVEIKDGETEIRGITATLSQLQVELAQSQDLLHQEQSVLSELSLAEYQSQLSYWTTQAAVTEQAMQNASAQYRERKTDLEEAHHARNQVLAYIDSFEQEICQVEVAKQENRRQESDIIKQIEALRVFIDPTENELAQAEAEQDQVHQTEGKTRQNLSIAYRNHSQAQLTLTRQQERLNNLRERIENDLGLVSFEYDQEISGPEPLPLDGMVERLPRVGELPDDMEENIKRQRLQVRRMGAINLDAQEEYQEVKQRFEFMTTQVEDLHKAERDIREVIAELDVLMERDFRKTFEEVANEFRQVFTRLFGGGSARLVLTDPDNLTETGIDIEARLPGRRTQGLSLLSGGERSLTASALVFSLLKVSPTPFCVLDEVDAMLDEANVGRFRDLLLELSENTQFIVITHNRNTVQAADVIYGVTMGRDSVSQMISLKLDEVAQVV
jgi:chromosome segregation protein